MDTRILNSTHEIYDAIMGLGQRVFAIEAEINGIKGTLEEIRTLILSQRIAGQPQPPAGIVARIRRGLMPWA